MRSAVTTLMLTFALFSAAPAMAQTFPTRPVTLVVGFPSGTSVDIVARLIAPKLGTLLGQPVVVENRAGAGGNIAAGFVAHAAPDGYTLLLANSGITVSATLYAKLSYNLAHDLTGVTELASQPLVMIVANKLDVHTVKDFIAYARARPHGLNFASSGIGNIDHLATELFAHMAGLDMVHVPYQGSTAAMTDMISGYVSIQFNGVAAARPFIQNHQVVALGVSSTQRSAALPDVPAIAESGLPGYDVTNWNGLLAPSATPPAIIARIAADTAKALNDPDTRQHFATLGLDAQPTTPADFQAFLTSETTKWGGVIKSIGLKVD